MGLRASSAGVAPDSWLGWMAASVLLGHTNVTQRGHGGRIAPPWKGPVRLTVRSCLLNGRIRESFVALLILPLMLHPRSPVTGDRRTVGHGQ